MMRSLLFRAVLFCAAALVLLSVGGFIEAQKHEQALAALEQSRYSQLAEYLSSKMKKNDDEKLSEELREHHLSRIEKSDLRNANKLFERENESVSFFVFRLQDDYLALCVENTQGVLCAKDLLPVPSGKIWSLYAAALAMLLIGFLTLIWLFWPLRAVQKMAQKLKRGELDGIIAPKGSGEIAELGVALAMAADTVKRLLSDKERLIYDLSHELRTPIQRGKAALALMEESKTRRALESSFVQMNEIVEQTLKMGQIGEYKLQKQVVHSDEIVRKAAEQLGLQIAEEGSDFEFLADRQLMITLLKNLIENADKFKTSGRVLARYDDSRIYIENDADKPLENFQNLLKPFTQEDQSRGGGFGLGLCIADKIAKIHDFKLGYEYRNGKNILFVSTGRL